MDKVKFRNEKAKAYSEKSILKMLDKAFPCDATDDDEDEDEAPKKRAPKSTSKKASKKKVEEDDDDDDYDAEEEWEDDEVEDDSIDYSEMSAKELYKLCKERNIEVKPKKPERYYITLLEELDAAQEDWGDEDDDWEDE